MCKPAPSRPEEAASPSETKTWEALFPGCRSSGKPDAEPNPASYRNVLSLLQNVDGDRICCPLRVRTSPWHPHPKGVFGKPEALKQSLVSWYCSGVPPAAEQFNMKNTALIQNHPFLYKNTNSNSSSRKPGAFPAAEAMHTATEKLCTRFSAEF